MASRIGFASKLPVEYGDDTVLIFMRLRDGEVHKKSRLRRMGNGAVNSTDLASPYFLPVFGEYSDHGRIDTVQKTKVTDYISEFFGMEISDVIKNVGQYSSRGECDNLPPKNEKIFKELTYGLEHKYIYEGMSRMVGPVIAEYGFTDFLLTEMGFTKHGEDGWSIHGLDNIVFVKSFGTMRSLNKESGKELKHFHYTREIVEELTNLGIAFKNVSLTEAEISLIETKKAIVVADKLESDGEHYNIFDKYQMPKDIYLINRYLSQSSIDGHFTFSHDSRSLPTDVIGVVEDQVILDFTHFHMGMEALAYLYTPSMYCNDDSNIEKHYQMLKLGRDVIRKKLEAEEEDHDTEGFYDDITSDIKSWDRSDKIESVL